MPTSNQAPISALTKDSCISCTLPRFNGTSSLQCALVFAVLALPLSAVSQAGRAGMMRNMEDAIERQRPSGFVAPPISGNPQPGVGPAPSIRDDSKNYPSPGAGRALVPPVIGLPAPGTGPAPMPPVAEASRGQGPLGLPGQGVGVSRAESGSAPPPAVPPPRAALVAAPAPAPALPPRTDTSITATPVTAPSPAAVIVVNPAPAPAPTVAAVPAVLPPLTDPTKTPTQGVGNTPDVFVGQGVGLPVAPSIAFAPASGQAPPTTTASNTSAGVSGTGQTPLASSSGGSSVSPNTAGAQPAFAVTPDRMASQGVGTYNSAALGTSFTTAPASTVLSEILPGAQELNQSRQLVRASLQPNEAVVSASATAKTAAKCQTISIRPDAQRMAVSLVDFTGDKLIVAAVPDAHINAVFERAGYNRLDLSQAATWCVLPVVARELLQPVQNASTQEAALVVQSGGNLQLMSRDQWLSYQASLKPPVVASVSNKTARPLKSGGRLNAKSSGQSGKPSFNLLRSTTVSGKSGGSPSSL